MAARTRAWQLLSILLAGVLNDHQLRIIEYLKAENQILRDQVGIKRIRLSDEQRRKLTVLRIAIGRKQLTEFCSIVTPDTILRWHRKFIAMKNDGISSRGIGRPRIMQEIRHLIVRFATANRSWGYERIEGELRKVGHCVARATVANILKEHGLEPAPK